MCITLTFHDYVPEIVIYYSRCFYYTLHRNFSAIPLYSFRILHEYLFYIWHKE